jgi:hypothetical protein
MTGYESLDDEGGGYYLCSCMVFGIDAGLLIRDLLKAENIRIIKTREVRLGLPSALSAVARNPPHPGNSSDHPPHFGPYHL